MVLIIKNRTKEMYRYQPNQEMNNAERKMATALDETTATNKSKESNLFIKA